MFYRPAKLEEGVARVTVMDAGQGLSVLIQTRNRNLLFDTGTEQVAQTGIVPSLNAMGVRPFGQLDFVAP